MLPDALLLNDGAEVPPDVLDGALQAKADALNARFAHHSASAVLDATLAQTVVGQTALVSSFGAESVALLHMVALIDRATPVLFIDSQMLFAETLVYQQEIAERLRLENVRIIRAASADLRQDDPNNDLHQSDPDQCCALRKTVPLNTALGGFDSWITGRKRFQSGTRAQIEFFEVETGTRRIKVNPLAHWRSEDLLEYIQENRLPRHPLVSRGYPSIGCQPCTTAVAPGEDPRSGRWRGQEKTECGIHFVNGKPVRSGP